MTFTGSIFTKLATTQQKFVVTFCTEFAPNSMKKCITDKISFTPICRAWPSLHQFSRNSKLRNDSNTGICTKFTEIVQQIHTVRIKAHSCSYVKNDCHRADFQETPVFLTSCEERNFRWRNIHQTSETVHSQRIWYVLRTEQERLSRRKVLRSAYDWELGRIQT
jgi:hypothetical protein